MLLALDSSKDSAHGADHNDNVEIWVCVDAVDEEWLLSMRGK